VRPPRRDRDGTQDVTPIKSDVVDFQSRAPETSSVFEEIGEHTVSGMSSTLEAFMTQGSMQAESFRLLRAKVQNLAAEQAFRCIGLVSSTSGEGKSTMALGLADKTIRLTLHQGIAGLVAATGQSIVVHDAYADARFYRAIDEATGYRTRQILCVPIKTRRGDVLGALELLNKGTGQFTPEDEEVLLLLATQLGVSLANAQLYAGLRTNLDRVSRLMKVGAAFSSATSVVAVGMARIGSLTTWASSIARFFG
jgi:GAF domain-containing protein